jgi:hypothetical protein
MEPARGVDPRQVADGTPRQRHARVDPWSPIAGSN